MSLRINNLEISGEIINNIFYDVKPTGTMVKFTIQHHEIDASKINIFPCIAWNDVADYIYNDFRKGDNVIINGKLRSNNYYKRDSSKWNKGIQIWISRCRHEEEWPDSNKPEINDHGTIN